MNMRCAALEMALKQYGSLRDTDEVIRIAEKFCAFLETGKVPGKTDPSPDFVADKDTLKGIEDAYHKKAEAARRVYEQASGVPTIS